MPVALRITGHEPRRRIPTARRIHASHTWADLERPRGAGCGPPWPRAQPRGMAGDDEAISLCDYRRFWPARPVSTPLDDQGPLTHRGASRVDLRATLGSGSLRGDAAARRRSLLT